MNNRDKLEYRAELISEGRRFIPAMRVLGRVYGQAACKDVRDVLAAAFNLAGPTGSTLIDLVAVTNADPFLVGTVAEAIIQRFEHGGGPVCILLVRSGPLAKQLLRELPRAGRTERWNDERGCTEVHLVHSPGQS